MTRFFVMVNIDDELYESSDGGGGGAPGQAECEFDEFCEIITRSCNEKLPPPHDKPFVNIFDDWLTTEFLPKMRAAMEAEKERGGRG